MDIIKCSECGKEISSQAIPCPHCGFRVNIAPIDRIMLAANERWNAAARESQQKAAPVNQQKKPTEWKRIIWICIILGGLLAALFPGAGDSASSQGTRAFSYITVDYPNDHWLDFGRDRIAQMALARYGQSDWSENQKEEFVKSFQESYDSKLLREAEEDYHIR